MSSHELSRFVDFAGKLELETHDSLKLRDSTREVLIMIQLMRSHLEAKLETPSSLIASSGLSRGTAHRVVKDMIDRGLIVQRPRTRSGKTFSLHPSENLLADWFEYARRMKSIIGTVFGLSEEEDYFFGASYMSASIIPPLPVLEQKLPLDGDLRILLHADPTFMAMNKVKRQLEVHFGTGLEARALTLDRLRDEILENAELNESRYDIVTCDFCWMAEMSARGAVLPIEPIVGQDTFDILDFHPEAVAACRFRGDLYGVPVQTTPELLIYRTDLLSEKDIAPPTTIEATLDAARRLHDPSNEISGIAWNGARGTPAGTTFMMIMADFGQPVLDLPKINGRFVDRGSTDETFRPMIDTPAGHQAADYLLELLDYSPPNVLQMSWYERAKAYAEGEVAMAYCYTQITPIFERSPESPAYGKTGYLPHPAATDQLPIAPLGGWALCIPSSLPEDRQRGAIQAIRTLTSGAATKLYMENGSVVSARFSVCNDPNIATMLPIIPIVDQMARNGVLQGWPRPAIPELSRIVGILGDEIHAMLVGSKDKKTALADAQNRCDALLAKKEGE